MVHCCNPTASTYLIASVPYMSSCLFPTNGRYLLLFGPTHQP